MVRIGIDVGGTFTDFILMNEADGAIRYYKVPSTPGDPSEAIESGLRQLMTDAGVSGGEVGYLGHGTTVATNIVIERKGARTGLLTTKGFRDVLELGRQARPSIYDYRVRKPPPLVSRERRVEVDERIGPEGTALRPLDKASLEAAVLALKAAQVEAVAICFLHSYLAPAHEEEARRAVQRLMPDVYVSVSSRILPEFREFERMSTTVVNAFTGPRMGRYLDEFRRRVASLGIPAEPYTIHSNGGLMSVETARDCPVRTCVSGPAAGVVGAAAIGVLAGFPDLITFDVGGTSTDVSLIDGGLPLFTGNRLVAGYPVKTPMIDIHVIGAGGGSIAAVDSAGALKVGPRSAGASPGPVAYGLGGLEATITDANLCLGRLDPDAFLGGRMYVDLDAARRVITETVAQPLGLTMEAAAHGIIQIANANMSRAIRAVSIERGYSITDFALAAFGGAGPLHAAEVAVECGIPSVLIPIEPGTLCARGMLHTDLSSDYVRSCFCDADPASWLRVLDMLDGLVREGDAWLDREAVSQDRRHERRILDARYRGQNFEVKVDCSGFGAGDFEEVVRRFHAAHDREYGYFIADRPIEFVTCRVQSVGEVPKPPVVMFVGGPSLEQARTGSRPVYIDTRHGWQDSVIYERTRLPAAATVQGPCVINEMSATTIVLPGQSATVDPHGNIILQVAP